MLTPSTSILLADDHKLFRKALAGLLHAIGLSIEIREAANGVEAIEILKSNPIDLVLLDIQMPLLSGIEVMKQIRDLDHRARVIVLTQFDEQSLIVYMFQLGAHGFLRKDCDPRELKEAITKVMIEGHYYGDIVLKAIGENISKNRGMANLEISSREFQVMVLLKEGKSSKEISTMLNLTVRTIESYRKALMKKTHCRNVAEMVSLAYRTGLVTC